MKAVLNVIEVGIVAVACASLLSACDGRGVTPFKSKQYSSDELALHKLQRDGRQTPADTNKDGNLSGGGGDPSAPTPSQLIGGGGGQGAGAGAAAGDGKSTLVTVGSASAAQQVVDSGNAHAKVYLEYQTLMDLVEKYLRPQDPSAVIAAVKGIDITVDPGQNSRLLSIDARVSLGGQEQNLFVAQAPIGPTDQNGKVEPLPITMGPIDNSTAPGPADRSKVLGYGFCREADCKTIHVILDFQLAKGGAVAVFALQINDSSKAYEIVESSLGEQRKSFCEATGAACSNNDDANAGQGNKSGGDQDKNSAQGGKDKKDSNDQGGVTQIQKSAAPATEDSSKKASIDLNSPPTVSQLQTLASAKKSNTLAQLVLADTKSAQDNDVVAAALANIPAKKASADLNASPTVSPLQTVTSAKKPNTLAQLVLVDAKSAPGNDEMAAALSNSANRGDENSGSILFKKSAPTVEATNRK